MYALTVIEPPQGVDDRIVATGRGGGVRRRRVEHTGVESHARLCGQIAQEQDDVLGTIQLVQGDAVLEDRLYDQLVDLLIEGLFLELRRRHLVGELAMDDYVDELSALSAACHDVRSEEHTSELQSLMRNVYAVF